MQRNPQNKAACLLLVPHKLPPVISTSLSIGIAVVESVSTSINFTRFIPLLTAVYV